MKPNVLCKDPTRGRRLLSLKTLLAMKLTFILLIAACLQVNAGGYAQKITLSQKNVSLSKLFHEIRDQSGYLFLYNNQQLNDAKKVTIKVKDASIEEVLEQSFKDQSLTYTIINKTIVVMPKERVEGPILIPILPLIPPPIKIHGKVVNQQGEPLQNVSVLIVGTNVGTATSNDGNFTLTAPDDKNIVLEISSVGFQTKRVNVGKQTEINVTLEEDITGLSDVVVVGYGTQKRTNLTGAVSVINSEDINKRAVNNSVQALQGLAPNLNVSVNSSGGEPDATMNLNIRGTGSLSSSDPFILIDGVRATQSEFASINPTDIQSISVLKDAASAAIYGSQAAYGVILVTTKSGKKNQKPIISLSSNARLRKQIYVPPSVNSLEFARVANVASQNFNGQTTVSQAQLDKIQTAMQNHDQYGTAVSPSNPNQWLGIGAGTSNDWFSGFANVDWYKVMYKNTEITQKHDITIRGGSDKVTYYLSGGFFDDPGFLRYGDKNDKFRRFNFNSTISTDITKWLMLSNTTRFNQVNDIFPASAIGGSRERLFHDIMRWVPLTPYKTPPVLDNQGNVVVPEQLVNMAGMNENNGFDEYQIDNLVSTFKAEIKIMESLKLKGDFSFKRQNYDGTLNFKKWTLLGPDGESSLLHQGNNNEIQKDWRKTSYSSFNIYADYQKSFSGIQNLQLLVGYQQEHNQYSQLLAGRKDIVDNNLNSINVGVGDIIGPDNPISAWATMGAFGRLSYNYKEKYLFEFNGRYDGSSKFAEGHRFGFFPSVSAGYNIYKEKFWQPISNIISTMKIRASFGKLGNQNVPDNLYLSGIPINLQLPWAIGGERPVYTTIPSIVSPNVTWEIATTKNIGMDMTFLHNRLSVSADVYNRQTDNMFGPVSALPAALGTDPPKTNSASLSTKGWELVIGWQQDVAKNFSYYINVLLADNISKITKYNNPTKVLSDWYVGQTIGEIWGFKAYDLFKSKTEVDKYLSTVDLSYFGTGRQAGNVKYLDLTGDSKVNVGDNTQPNPGDQIIIGNSLPRYSISINGGVSWKHFDFSMLWQGIGKIDIMPNDYASLFWGWNRKAHSHITKASLDYWSEDNIDAYLPIPLDNNGRAGYAKDRYPSTRYLQNGAYIRLKNLDIGYTLPSSLTDKIKFKNIRIYLSGENLLTFTRMWPTLDPEIAATGKGSEASDGIVYPLSQSFTFGFDITF